jgi:putative transposase
MALFSCTHLACCDPVYCPKVSDAAAFPSATDETKVPHAVCVQAQKSAWSEGPAQELIDAVVEMKRRNPTWGCPRIAQQITLAFGVDIDKGVVRRILGKLYGQESGFGCPSWLTFLGQAKDSLWSIGLFRCESLRLRTHWVLVVMDQFTRRIIGFGIHRETVDGPSLCSMFHRAIMRTESPPSQAASKSREVPRSLLFAAAEECGI